MSVERRLAEALHALDKVEPSADLFARVERSVSEDQIYRRRRLHVLFGAIAALAAVGAWVWLGVVNINGTLIIESWRMVVAYLTVAGGLVISLAPHIRRFAGSFVDDVFHLSPATGGRFLRVLDIAYYMVFSGLVLVDADVWELGTSRGLAVTLGDFVGNLGFLLLIMGVLHAGNIALLPLMGVVYNSIVRRDLRRRAGESAPQETLGARIADRNARSIAIGLMVLALSVLFTIVVGGPGGALLSGLS